MMSEVKDPPQDLTPQPMTTLKPRIPLDALIKFFTEGSTEENSHRKP